MTDEQILAALSQEEILALTLYGESRGEPIQGQIAVANVVRNRVLTQKMSYRNICLAPKQFSCWNENDPNYVLLTGLAEEIKNGKPITDKYMKQCFWVAMGIVDDELLDNTNGALYYLTNDLFFSDKQPSWSFNYKQPRTIGNQTFFNV